MPNKNGAGKTKEPMRKKKSNYHTRALKLVHQLDTMSLRIEGATSAALLSQCGLVFSWQKKKLENVEFSLKHLGDPYGFIVLTQQADDSLSIFLNPIPDKDGAITEAQLKLSGAIDYVLEAVDPAECELEPEDVNRDFQKEFKFCSTCGRCEYKPT